MMSRTSAPPRGPRGASPAVHGRGRGGIQKRKGGPAARVDKDGDLDMGAAVEKRRSGRGRGEATKPPVGPRGTGRGGSMSSQKAQQAIMRGMSGKQANVLESRLTTGNTTLKIEGLQHSKAASNADGGLENLLGFLERKASGLDAKSNRAVKIKKSHMKGDSVIITASPDDIAEIQKLDNFSFAGATLHISACEPQSPPRKGKGEKAGASVGTQDTKEKLRAVLAGRYDVNMKLLNLSALASDPGLLAMGVFEGKKTTSKVFPALMVVCDGLFKSREEKTEAIVSVTLTDNGLSNVSDVTMLAQSFPDIKNLDLSRNNLTDMQSLNAWRWKFRSLENLILSANPIEEKLATEKDELLKRYPHLQILNGIQVRTSEEVAANVAAAEAAKSPIPILPADFRDVAQVGENFVRQFLALYDSDRTALLANFYDNNSLFSISVNMTSPRDRQHTVAVAPWDSYKHHSRNLTKITRLPAKMNRQYRSVKAIQGPWATLPPTRHPDLQTQPEKYIIECKPQPGLPDPNNNIQGGVDGLQLTLHGEFEEPNPVKPEEKTLRSFSRTFVIGPGAAGGPPIRVISDMMVLRAWGPLPAIQQPHNISPAEDQQREAIIRQLVERTGMTIEYAVLCLTETAGDIEQAFAAFTANKDRLPAEAFMPNTAI